MFFATWRCSRRCFRQAQAKNAPLASHLTFNFPELHLVTFGLVLLMGQYTGYKLSELRRFSPVRDFS